MKNLIAEMGRYGVSNKALADLLDCDVATVRNRISGKTQFTVDDALKIRDVFFPGMQIEYLFASAKDDVSVNAGM